MTKSVQFKKISVLIGVTKHAFGLGFHVDRWSLGIDLGPLWIAMEW